VSVAAPANGLHRVVLDTNVVLDLILFEDARAAGLSAAVAERRIEVITDPVCIAELQHVLAYPLFSLNEREQEELSRKYLGLSVMLSPCTEKLAARLPICSDPDDQKFIQLAWRHHADLVTRDKALLRLRNKFAKVSHRKIGTPGRIGTPEDLFP